MFSRLIQNLDKLLHWIKHIDEPTNVKDNKSK